MDFFGDIFMDLLFWCYVEVEDGDDDMKWCLIECGEKQVWVMVVWICVYQLKNMCIIVSLVVCVQQIVQVFKLFFEIECKIGFEVCVFELIVVFGWLQISGLVMLVGYQFLFGCFVVLFLVGYEVEWMIKKGVLWWLSNCVCCGDIQIVLCVVILVELLEQIRLCFCCEMKFFYVGGWR